jgi:hypothetical protein
MRSEKPGRIARLRGPLARGALKTILDFVSRLFSLQAVRPRAVIFDSGRI